MKKTKSSRQWMQAHCNDPFVQQSKRDGYRSRAVYKLKEVDEKYHLIQRGMTILELGAAPGGWTQYVTEKMSGHGRVVAVDCLSMDALPCVDFIQGDFTEPEIQEKVLSSLKDQKADLMLSDMAPNLSGVKSVDSLRTVALAELTLASAETFLKSGGCLFMKIFHGTGIDAFIKEVRVAFDTVSIRKPLASRSQSRETYLLARGYRL